MRKFISFFLSLTIVLSIVFTAPVTVSAVDAADLTFTLNSDGASYSVKGRTNSVEGVLEIPSEYQGLPVTAISNSAFSGYKGITKVVIPEGVVTIGTKAFYNCTGISEITIPTTVTTIGNNAFYSFKTTSVYIKDLSKWCEIAFGNYSANPIYLSGSLVLNGELISEELVIPQGVTAIKNYAFYSLDVKSVTIPDSVTAIGDSAFYENKALSSFVIPEGVTSIGANAFYACDALTNLTIPSTVISIGNSAFYNCKGLKNINISDIAKWCEIAFGNSSSNPIYLGAVLLLNEKSISEELIIPDGVTAINNYAFYSLDVESVIIPDSVTIIGDYAFYENKALTSIVIPEGVTKIGTKAFYYCEALADVTIPATVNSMGDSAFRFCSALKNIYISDIAKWCEITFYGTSGGNVFDNASYLYLNNVLQEHIVIPGSVKSISSYAFYNYKGLKSLTISEGVETIGQSVFASCKNLAEVRLPESLKTIGSWAFNDCSGISSLYISDLSKWCGISFSNAESNPIRIANEFYVDGELIEDLIIPEDVEKINACAFYSFDGLKRLYIPETLKSIGDYAFCYCEPEGVYISNLTNWCNLSMGYSNNIGNLYLNNELVEHLVIPEDVTTIGNYAFSGCTSIKELTITDGVTKINNYAFSDCSNLEEFSIGSAVTSIGESAFENCINLTEVIIPDTVTTISQYSFAYCTSLENVKTGDGVTKIPSNCFYKCPNLKSVSIGESVTSIASYPWDSLEELHITSLEKWCQVQKNGEIKSDLYLNGELVENLVVPENVATIKSYAFSGFKSIKSVTIPEGTTQISNYAFRYCDNLTEVNLPVSIKTISTQAFAYDNKLQDVFYAGSQEQWGTVSVKSNAIPSNAYIHYQVSDKDNHWEAVGITPEPHCTEERSQVYTCSCGNEKTVVIDAAGHSYSEEWTIDKHATCTEDGSKSRYCTVCGENTDVTVIEKLGHSYGDWIVTTEPTCTEEGTAKKICSACGDEVTQNLVIDSNLYPESDHNYANNISKIYEFNFEGASELILKFSGSTYTEYGYDYIYIYDETGRLYGRYTGSALSATTVTLPGDSFTLKLTSDGSSTEYGFSFDSIVGVFSLEFIKPKGHNYVWEYDTVSLTKIGVCSSCGETTGVIDMDGTDAITFTLNEDGTSYTVTDCLDSFYGQVNIPDTYNGLPVTAIGTDAFCDCTRLMDVIIPDSVTSIGGSAFRNCPRLTDVELPDNLITISGAMFYGCTNLESIIIPAGIKSVGGYAFSGCEELKYVFFKGDEASWNKITFGSSNTALTELPIHFNTTSHTCSEEWIIDLEPTCTENGYKHKECTVCKKTLETVEILAGHKFVGDTCTVCGSFDLSLFQSKHLYDNNTDEIWSIHKEGAKFIAITFDVDTETEYEADYIVIYEGEYDENGNKVYGYYSGTELAGKRIVVYGDTITINLVTDSTNSYYGFALEDIEVYFEDCKHENVTLVDAVGATCSRAGYTGDIRCSVCDLCVDEGEYVPIDEDAHRIQGVVHLPSCVEGYTLFECVYCEYSYKGNFTSPIQEHDYVNHFCANCNGVEPGYELPEIKIGESKEVTITQGGEYAYFSFTPESYGVYTFSSSGDCETVAYIYDSEMNTVYDGSFDLGDFFAEVELQAGETYLLTCKFGDNTQTGSFTVNCGYCFYFNEDVRIEKNEEANITYLFMPAKGYDEISDIVTISSDVQYSFMGSHTANEKEYYGTGAFLTMYSKDDAFYGFYGVIVNGDVNGDSVCDALDVSKIERVISGNDYLEYTELLFAAMGSSDMSAFDETMMPYLYQNVVNMALEE